MVVPIRLEEYDPVKKSFPFSAEDSFDRVGTVTFFEASSIKGEKNDQSDTYIKSCDEKNYTSLLPSTMAVVLASPLDITGLALNEAQATKLMEIFSIKKNQSVGKLNADVVLTTSTEYERNLIQELGKRVRQRAQQKEYKNDLYTDFNSRLAAIPWGGIALFKGTTPTTRMWWATSDNDSIDGHEILFNYLDTMKWPEDLHTKSSITSKPLCSHQSKGCPVGEL